MQTIRVFFEKKDIARYLSHLDLMRCFTRAVKRTGADVWYTEGFNPHLYLMFPAPLSLGFESTYEVVDLRMNQEENLESFVSRLNDGLPLGVRAFRAAPAVASYKDVAFSRWSISINSEDIKKTVLDYVDQDQILVRRKNKKGVEREENIKENIRYVSVERTDTGINITCELTSSPAIGLNPSLFLEGLRLFRPELVFEVESITRIALLDVRGQLFV